ncbi:MAG: phosphotransferase [Janthinobacterium sp.]|jgi:hypothetical protein
MSPKIQFMYLDRNGNNCDPSNLLERTRIAAFEDIIKSLHGQVVRVAVSSLSGGRSGAKVLLVRRTTNEGKLHPVIVKTAEDTKLIVKEKENYETHVRHKLRHAPNLLKEDSLFLVYEYANTLFDDPSTLRDGYHRKSISDLRGFLKRLVEVLFEWYTKSARPITNMEQMTLEPPLDATIRSLGIDFSPYQYLAEWWEEFRITRSQVSTHNVYRCHGDLNVGNIMLDMDSVDPVPVFIDFYSIDEEIEYWDFAKLDRDIKTRLFLKEALQFGIDEKDIKETVSAIDSINPLEREGYPYKNVHPIAKKAYTVAKSLRYEVVDNRGNRPFNDYYYNTLTYVTLLTLYRKEPDQGIHQRIQNLVACESAAALLSRLLQRPRPHLQSKIKMVSAGYSDKSPSEFDHYVGLSHGDFLQLLGERIREAYGDICYVAIAGQELFKSEIILQALEDDDKTAIERTIRVYLLRSGTRAFDEYVRLSNEDPDIFMKKFDNTKMALKNLVNSDKHSRLRIELYLYDAIPSVNLLETPTGYVFRPYHIGEALGKFDVMNVRIERNTTLVAQTLRNYIQDLSYRSEEIDIRSDLL